MKNMKISLELIGHIGQYWSKMEQLGENLVGSSGLYEKRIPDVNVTTHKMMSLYLTIQQYVPNIRCNKHYLSNYENAVSDITRFWLRQRTYEPIDPRTYGPADLRTEPAQGCARPEAFGTCEAL